MRWTLMMLLPALSVGALRADTFVYVSMAPEQKIRIYRMDIESGKLTEAGAVSTEGAPGALAVDPQRRFLFASLRTNATLAAYRIDAANGGLLQTGVAALPKGENAANLATDRTGHLLLSASYAAGKVVVHRVTNDGQIAIPPMQTVTTAKTAHCIAVAPDNKFVFVPHVEPNAVFRFKLDANLGKLTTAGKTAGGAEKAGPRHLVFHPTLKMAFGSDETGSSITAYRFDPAAGLTAAQTVSTLPADFKGANTTADVKIHPNGRFAWVSNRGHDSLAGFSIGSDGKLLFLGTTPTEKTPRSIDIDPDGRFLLAAGEGSGKLAVYRIDADTGALTRAHTLDVGKSLTWVMAVRIGAESIFARGAGLRTEAGDGAGGEGPAWHPELGVLTSGHNGDIRRLDRKGESTVHRKGAGTNGLLFDAKGRLLACEAEKRRITRTEADGTVTVLTDKYQGKRYNQPNDLTVDSKGRIYFSDPFYGGDRKALEMKDEQGKLVEGVYRIDPDGTVTRIIGRELERPNGVLVSADDKHLFVADNNNDTLGGARKLYRFDLRADGTVDPASRKLLHDWGKGRGPDGLKQDRLGRLYVAGGLNKPNPPFEPAEDVKGGIYVLSPEGELLEFLPVPTDEVTNCAFGGDDLKTLYITGGGTLYSIPTAVAGRVVWPPAK